MNGGPRTAPPAEGQKVSSQQPFQNFVAHFGAGERIFTEGDLGATMYIVQTGRVRLFRTHDGEKRPQGYLDKGDFFGEGSVLEGLPRNVSAEAAEPCDLIEINSVTFERMIKGNIEVAVRMLRKMSVRLREAERRIDHLEETRAPAATPAPSRPAAPPKPVAAAPTGAGARLDVEGESTTFTLLNGETLIGRFDPVSDLKPDVDLTSVDLKRTVSRRHARIVKTESGYFITEEMGALNGTFVNGNKLVTGKPQPLGDGDRVGLGMVKMIFRVS